MRLVLDSNVIIAAFASRGLCEALFAVCLQSHEIVLSGHTLNEVVENLRGKVRMPRAQAREIETLLRDFARLVEPASLPPGTCRDKKDLPVLGTAVAATADALVTGDADLLALGAIDGIPILSPRRLYDRLR